MVREDVALLLCQYLTLNPVTHSYLPNMQSHLEQWCYQICNWKGCQ